MYESYFAERLGAEVYKDDHGFLVFTLHPDEGRAHIEELYVLPDFRKTGVAAKYLDELERVSKSLGIHRMTCNISPAANGSTDAMKAALAYGFRLLQASENSITMVKELNNG